MNVQPQQLEGDAKARRDAEVDKARREEILSRLGELATYLDFLLPGWEAGLGGTLPALPPGQFRPHAISRSASAVADTRRNPELFAALKMIVEERRQAADEALRRSSMQPEPDIVLTVPEPAQSVRVLLPPVERFDPEAKRAQYEAILAREGWLARATGNIRKQDLFQNAMRAEIFLASCLKAASGRSQKPVTLVLDRCCFWLHEHGYSAHPIGLGAFTLAALAREININFTGAQKELTPYAMQFCLEWEMNHGGR